MAQFRVGNHEAIQSIIMAKHTFDVGSGSLKSSFDLLSLFDLQKRQLDAKERSNLPRILFINPQSLNNPSTIPQSLKHTSTILVENGVVCFLNVGNDTDIVNRTLVKTMICIFVFQSV